MSIARTVVILGAFVLDLGAQSRSFVLPPRYAAAEAETFTGLPFSRSTAVRTQLWYGPSYFGGKSTITEIAFRPDGGKAFRAKGLDVQIFLGTGPATIDRVSPVFVANRGADYKSCYQRRQQARLAAVSSAVGPRPFSLAFKLDIPFAYDPAKGGLLVEVLVYGQQPGRYEIDLGTQCTSQRAAFGRPGCRGSNGRVPAADSPTQALLWGQPFVMRVRNLLPNAPVLVAIGTIESGRWMGLQVPYGLDAIGAPGCTLNTDVAVAGAAGADATGEARKVGQIPSLASLVGRWFRYQAMVLDLKANALGLTFSNGSKTQVCGPNPMARVVSTNIVAITGALELGVTPVTRFTRQ